MSSKNNQQDVIKMLELYDYSLVAAGDSGFHMVQGHGDFDTVGDDLDFILSYAVGHYLKYTLGMAYVEVWQALKRFNQHKAIFPYFADDIDKMIAWDAIYHAEFMAKWELDKQAQEESRYEDFDLPF